VATILNLTTVHQQLTITTKAAASPPPTISTIVEENIRATHRSVVCLSRH
jgi:hypothetical protein